MSSGIRTERLFTDLCNRYFLRGFVFHSPQFFNPTENEAGDVVLWVRLDVVVFELISRDTTRGSTTKQFIKRIGQKRDQLLKDYRAFKDPNIDIHLVNEQGEQVPFDIRDRATFDFSGVVIVDCSSHIEKLHFGTIEKSLALPFPVAIMSRQDFLDLTAEVGLDHGAGHSLLLLCDAKASRGKNSMKFKGLGDDLFNVFISLF